MNESYFQDQSFNNLELPEADLTNKELDNCTFVQCNFSNADFSKSELVDCVFENCNLSMAKVAGTGLKNVAFKQCKLVGVEFMDTSDFLFSVSFDQCVLDFAAFSDKKMPGTFFNKCKMEQTDFTNTKLARAVFKNCDLINAVFENTDLGKADFRSSFNYVIDPEMNNIRRAKFSMDGVEGLLKKYEVEIE